MSAPNGGRDPAETAAEDQYLAAMAARLDASVRRTIRGGTATTVAIAALIAAFLAARPAVHLWELVAALALAAMLAAETVVHGLMLRSHREEVRELRARLPM